MPENMIETLETLITLSECPGVSGKESEVSDAIKECIAPYVDELITDSIGNLIAIVRVGTFSTAARTGPPALDNPCPPVAESKKRCLPEAPESPDSLSNAEEGQEECTRSSEENRRPRTRIMLAAHMDEIGLLITHIEDDGTLRFGCVGGIDAQVLTAKRVTIGKNRIPGVILWKPIHLEERGKAGKEPPKAEDFFIDIGALTAEEARKAVKPGDFAWFETSCYEFGNGLIKGKALDDRIGCLLLVELIKRRDKRSGHAEPKIDPRSDEVLEIAYVFTVQEEVGLRGAACAANALNPDIAIVVETTVCQDTPGSEPHQVVTKIGDGPAITFMDRTSVANKRIVEELWRIAAEKGIRAQHKAGTAGGNDAGSIHMTCAGIPTATVSVPCRYIHSPVSVASISDINGALALLEGFLESVEGGFSP